MKVAEGYSCLAGGSFLEATIDGLQLIGSKESNLFNGMKYLSSRNGWIVLKEKDENKFRLIS